MEATENLLQDIRYAIRSLARTPAFTLTALAALTLGIGTNAAIFSVINAVLLKPLSFPDPARMVQFFIASPNGPLYGSSSAKFNVWRETPALQNAAAYEYSGVNLNLASGDHPESVHAIRASAEYFRLLGAPIAIGRTFTAAEDSPRGGRVVVISFGLWQRAFGGDPKLVGKTISLGGEPYLVIGIVGSGFRTELDTAPDVWLPFQLDPNSSDHAQYFSVLARLRPGATMARANAELRIASDAFRRKYPNILGPRDYFAVESFPDSLVSDVRPSLLVLAGAVGLVLLIACANVAGLLLVRATGRKAELAVRAALGAGRGRLIRQLLTESSVLSLGGGALGLGLGFLGARALLTISPIDMPRIGEHGAAVTMDWRVAGFTFLLAIGTGLLFGLIPALSASRSDLNTALKEGGRSEMEFRQGKTRSLLVIAETMLSVVLLIGAGLLIRSFVALRSVDAGFNGHNVLTVPMSLTRPRLSKSAGVEDLILDAIPRLNALPGVTGATASYIVPLEGAFGVPYQIAGNGNSGHDGGYDGRGWMCVSPSYFKVFQIPILRGRGFTNGDRAGTPGVALINQAMARKFWPEGDAVGGRLILGKGYAPGFDEPERVIVGVTGDIHDSGLALTPQPLVYVPMAQVPDGITAVITHGGSLVWSIRTHVPPYSLRAPIENALREASGGLPVARVRSMDELRSESTARASFNMTLLTIFGGSALLLAAIGIYGLMAYSVTQRTQELAIRMALGAEPRRIRKMVMLQGMRTAFAGIVLGVAAGIGFTRVLASFLFSVSPRDPPVFILAPGLLGVVALLSAWLPAHRAAHTDPVEALRRS